MDCARLIDSLNGVLDGGKGVATLTEELKRHAELSIFDNTWQCHGNSAVECQLRSLADWLIKNGRILGSDVVVANLERYITASSIPYREIMVLAGVATQSRIVLSKDIELVPFETLRDSFLKEHIREQFRQSYENYHPRAVLQRSVSYPREHVERTSRPVSRTPWDMSFQALDDARLCMTAIGPCAPITLSSWIEAADWVPDWSGGVAYVPELFAIGGYPRAIAEDWAELPAVHESWVRLSEKERKHLRVPLKRINSAIRRMELIDSGIDLGIAIDALFLSEREPERGELGFTLRLRAARYLGTDEASRRDISRLFSSLYHLRSVAVHSGEVDATTNGTSSVELLNRGYKLTARAIRRIIQDGEPDWRNLVFQ